MQAELEESSALLEEMGRKMGKTLSEAMVEEIRAALAAANLATGASYDVMASAAGTPAQAATQASLVAGSPFLNGTAIMQSIQTAIEESNRRLGRTGQVLNA